MTALAASRNTKSREPGIRGYTVAAATTIYKGGLVAINAGGYLVPASDAANLVVVGVAFDDADNSAGANGDIKCRVQSGRSYLFDVSPTALTQADVGNMTYVEDDQTVSADSNDGTNAIDAGIVEEFVSATEGWIWIPLGGFIERNAVEFDSVP